MPKNKDDILLDSYIESQGYINRFDFVAPDNFKRSLEQIQTDIEKTLREQSGKRTKRVERLKVIRKQIKEQLSIVYSDLDEDIKDELLNTSKVAYESANAAFKEGFNLTAPSFAKLPIDAIATFTALEENIIFPVDGDTRLLNPKTELNKLFLNHSKQYTRAVRNSLAQGQGIKETVREFRKQVGKIDGFQNAYVETIMRTSVAETMAKTRKYTEDKNFSSVITGYQHITVFDTRTSKICSARAGMIRKKREDFDGVPPLHPRCRSILVPVTSFTDTKNIDTVARTWDETIYADRDKELHTRFKLASDKDVSVKVTDNRSKFSSFDEWFRRLPQDRQVQWLGPQKYKLYNTGKIGTRSLIDGSGRIRTVSELGRIAGLNKTELKEVRRRDIKAYQPKVTKSAQKVINEREAEQVAKSKK